MESDGLGLDLALLDIDLVTTENNGDVLANSDEITCMELLVAVLMIFWRGTTHGASWERSCR